jgi:hypothetical protein
MDITNKTVNHKTFGKGKIFGLKDNIITVDFGSETKKFIFPDAFREHLFLSDEQGREYIDDVLARIDEEVRLKREEELRQEEKKKLLRSLPLHQSSQAAFAFMCNERQKVIEDGAVSVGNYRSGVNRGQPRIPSRIYPNSACLLTYRDEDDPEEKRYIWGAFMARDDFAGPECSDGMISAHKKYRIALDEDNFGKFLFWDYCGRDLGAKGAKWGSVEFKYFSNSTMLDILRDMCLAAPDGVKRELCEEFIEYFCKLNKLDKKTGISLT